MDLRTSRTGSRKSRSFFAFNSQRLWLICVSVLMALGCAVTFLATVSHTAKAYHASRHDEGDALRCIRSARLTLGDLYAREANRLRTDASFWVSYATEDAAKHALAITSECDRSLGAGFLRQAAATAGDTCHSAADNSSSSSSSSGLRFFAYPVKQAGLGCAASNLVVDGSRFIGDDPPLGAPQHEAYIPNGSAATVKLACALNFSIKAVSSNLQHDHLPWFTGAYAQATAGEVSDICNDRHSTAYKTPAMFVTRLDPTNPYHHTQSVVQAFLSLAALDSTSRNSNREQGLQVILADHFIDGPFLDIWKQISYPHPVLRLKNLTRSGEYICFKQALLAHYTEPNLAFMGYEGHNTEHACPSTIIMAVSHWLRYMFLATTPAPYNLPSIAPSAAAATAAAGATAAAAAATAARHLLELPRGHQRLNVVFFSRSWFERSMAAGGGLNSWQKQRAMAPAAEAAVVHALQDVVQKWNQQACVPPVFGWWQSPRAVSVQQQQGCKPTNVSFDLQVADFSLLELYPSQFQLLLKAAVLVAAHGAALTNMIFMRPHMGAVVEVFHGLYHYVNQAHMLGHKHFKTDRAPKAIAAAVTSAMDHVSNKYQQQLEAPVKM